MQLLQTKISNFKSPQSIKRLQFLKEERDNLSRDKVRNITERWNIKNYLKITFSLIIILFCFMTLKIFRRG